MITTTVVGKVKTSSGDVVEGAEIAAKLNTFDYDPDFGYITNRRISTTTDVNGEFSFELWPNTRGTEGTFYRVLINSPIQGISTSFVATIPEQGEVDLNDASELTPQDPLDPSFIIVADNITDINTAADNITAIQNAPQEAQDAADSADAAAISENNALNSANAAASAETDAINAKDQAVAAKNATENIFDTFDDRFLGSFASDPTVDNDGNPIVAGAVYYNTTQQEVYFYNGATWDAPAAQAETSANNALNSEQAAQQAANEAEQALDTFTDQYLGAKASEPTTDNDGDPLVEGTLFFDTTVSKLKVYDGSAWQLSARLDSDVRGLFSADGDLSYNSTTGEFSVTTYKSSDFDTDFASKTTDDLTEGTSNFYYADNLVDSHLSGGTGVTYSTGNISIGQDVGTTADVTFNSIDSNDADFTNRPQVSGDDVALQLETIEGRKQEIAQGFVQREGTRGDLDVDLAVAIELNLLGAPVAGGYYAGLIDTVAGTIIAADDYQTGLRYALIVAPKDLEGGRGSSPASGLPTGDLEWDTQDRGGEAGCFTRWNGLEATNVIIAKNDTSYEVHDFIEAVRSQYPAVSTPGGTEWYLPAMDELELLYRNFKPNNADNRDDTRNRNFPGTQVVGTNPSSAIEGFQYENSPRIPDVTYLDLFKEGNAQSIDLRFYWSTTDADEGGRAWIQFFTLSGVEGIQFARRKDFDGLSVRPVRRVVL